MPIDKVPRNCVSDKRRRKFCPAHIPIRDGTIARREAITNSVDSKAFVPSAKARATVDAVDSMPMDWISMLLIALFCAFTMIHKYSR